MLLAVRAGAKGVTLRKYNSAQTSNNFSVFQTSLYVALRNVSSRMRHFHGEFSVEPPRIVEAVC